MSEHDEEKARQQAQERGFVVVDRRGQDDEEDGASEPRAGSSGPEAQPGSAGGERLAGAPTSPGALPDIDLPMLLHSFALSALFHMGAAPDPATGEASEVNLPLAQQNIQILELLQQKTRGNLTEEEERLLEGLLYEVRMRYVEARKSGA